MPAVTDNIQWKKYKQRRGGESGLELEAIIALTVKSYSKLAGPSFAERE